VEEEEEEEEEKKEKKRLTVIGGSRWQSTKEIKKKNVSDGAIVSGGIFLFGDKTHRLDA
jgi:hypothetical protein